MASNTTLNVGQPQHQAFVRDNRQAAEPTGIGSQLNTVEGQNNTNSTAQESIANTSPDPHPATEAIVTETRHTAERWIPETHYLTIVDPTRLEREQDFSRLIVRAHYRQKCEEVLVDFRSNNLTFQFVLKALRRHFDGTLCFIESWEPEDGADEPF